MDFKKLKELILIEQMLFALFLTYLGVLFAGGGSIMVWVWVTIALVAARTAGMAFNRLIDTGVDNKNPRARDRLVPRGDMTGGEARMLALGSCTALVIASYMLNSLCFYLSFAAIALLFSYPYLKRFSAVSSLYPGVIEAAAPIGGCLAVTGEFELVPFILGAAIMAWIAGLDVVYAILDIEFDRGEGHRSVPIRYGRERALSISTGLYIAALAALAGGGALTKKGIAYWVAVLCVALIFFRQQSLARSDEVLQATEELFQINKYISPILFIGTFIDVFIG